MTENLFTPDTHLSENSIYIFIDALKLDRTDKLPEEIKEHVEECQQCKKEIIELYATVRGVSYSDGESHPFLTPQREPGNILYPILRVAAVIVIVIGTAVFLHLLFSDKEPAIVTEERTPEEIPHDKPDEDILYPEQETLPVGPTPTELFAANFIPVPLYEGLVDQQFRVYDQQVLDPTIVQEVTDEAIFRWNILLPDPITLRIINNRLETIYQKSTTDNSIRYTEPLDPGIYYWRLDTEKEILYVGKFIVPVPEQ
jgi:hypothetical protein